MDWKIFVVLTLVVAASQDGEGCSCLPMHKQHLFCQADFAIRFVVKRSIPTTPTPTTTQESFSFDDFLIKLDIYKVKILKRTQAFDKVLNKTVLYTGKDDGVCGIQFKEDTEYFITGQVRGDRLQVSHCDWNDEWSAIPQRQRRLIKHVYHRHCDTCQIKPCYGTCQWSDKTEGGCSWNSASPLGECYDRFAFCKRKASKAKTQCRWSYGRNMGSFLSCLNGRQSWTTTYGI